MIIEGTNVKMTRGDSEDFTVSCTSKATGLQLDFIEGDIVYFTVKDSVYTQEKRLQKVITSFVGGKAVISITPSDTKGLDFGQYVYDVQWSRPPQTVKTIVTKSNFIIGPEVTYE